MSIMKNESYMLIILLFCMLTGCNSEDSLPINYNNYTNSTIPVFVGVNGIVEEAEENLTRTLEKEASTVLIPVNEELGIVATLEPEAIAQTRSLQFLGEGIKYRVIAYKENDVSAGGYIAHADYTVGNNAPDFWLPVNCTYTFVCYSYGSESLDDFDVNATEVVFSENDTPLYCKWNEEITESNNNLTVELKYRISQVRVVVDASTSGYNITSCSGELTPSYTDATLSYANGNLKKRTVPASQKTLVWSSVDKQRISSEPVNVFTHGEIVTINLNTIALATLPTETVLKDKSVIFAGKMLEPGRKYQLTLAITKIGGIEIGNYIWATGNLVKTGDMYGFYSSQEICSKAWNGGDYWGWNLLDPLDYKTIVSEWSDDRDPCRRVAPQNTWFTPTTAQLKALGTAKVGTINKVNGLYFQSGKIFLPYGGTREGGKQYLNATTVAYYWTRDADGSSATYLYCYSPTVLFLKAVSRAYGLNIRCVRNKNK